MAMHPDYLKDKPLQANYKKRKGVRTILYAFAARGYMRF